MDPTQTDFRHTPVLLEEVLEALEVKANGRYCDGTVGAGGHAHRILERSGPGGVLVGLDRDPAALRQSERTLSCGERVILRHANYSEMVSILEVLELLPIDGILLDLGVSSHQLDTAARGFSFGLDGPLDMRMDPSASTTAAELIEQLPEHELARVLREYGEERYARRIARTIKQRQARGELRSTGELAALVVAIYRGEQRGRSRSRERIHPATRTFQALRIAVNDELGALERFLETFAAALRPGGRLVVISFHSLEDRAVKRGLASLANPCTCPPTLPVCACGARPAVRLVTRRPVWPGADEIERNPRARSARLRAAERL